MDTHPIVQYSLISRKKDNAMLKTFLSASWYKINFLCESTNFTSLPFRLGLLFFLLTPWITTNAQNSLLWEIKAESTSQPSYLYGTLHAQDERVFTMGEQVMASFDKCQALAVEMKMDSSVTEQVMSAMLVDEDYDLNELIADSSYQRLDSLLKANYGMGLFFFGRLKPMYLYLLLSQQGLQKDRTVFLDQYFIKRAKKEGMEVIGIETATEQLNALDYLSLKKQAALLEEAVWEQPNVQTEQFVDVYTNENLDSLHTLVQKGMSDSAFYQALITDRNLRMSDRIVDYVKEQPTFVAIGAGHLSGKKGVISLLKDKGLQVQSVISDRKISVDESTIRAQNWQRFQSDTAKFSITMPGQPDYHVSTVPTQQGNLDVHHYNYENSERKFFITYNQYPYDFQQEKMAEKVKNGLPDKLNAEILSSETVHINGMKGDRITLQDEQGKFIIVTYFLNGRDLYQLMVSGFGDSPDKVSAPRFFNSFELNEE